MGIPTKRGDYYYFAYNAGLQDQAITYRMKNKNERLFDIKQPLEVADVFFDPN